ncbi:MAG: glutamate racemase [Solirubrobacterales bacterium]|nr:glutamate racemase [Solirubrobacterales bacterium]MCO5316179.1 glutamate racemase [Solirubrobacterales bacterium]
MTAPSLPDPATGPSGESDLPIAMFDSGVGGLTVLHECLVSLPGEDFLYLGDSSHFPYGTKSPDELRERTGRIARHLLADRAKMLVIACNSATAAAGDQIRQLGADSGVPVLTVVGPEAEIAGAITGSGRIGVLATPATVRSGAYRRALESLGPAFTVTEVEAPDLAPIIQEGPTFDEAVMDTVRDYCRPLKAADVDTLILGCTHYPLVAPMLQRMLGRNVSLVTAGHAIAAAIQRELSLRGSLGDPGREGEYRFQVTGDPDSFARSGSRFLQLPLSGRVERIDL